MRLDVPGIAIGLDMFGREFIVISLDIIGREFSNQTAYNASFFSIFLKAILS